MFAKGYETEFGKLSGEVLHIPRSSRLWLLPVYYLVPKDIITERVKDFVLPRCPFYVLRTEKYTELLNSWKFFDVLMDVYSWVEFQGILVPGKDGKYTNIPGKKEQYSDKFPLYTLAYLITMEVWKKIEKSSWNLQRLFLMKPWEQIDWVSWPDFSGLVFQYTETIIAEKNWQPMIDAVWTTRAIEDYEKTQSGIKNDFLRSWYHYSKDIKCFRTISLEQVLQSDGTDFNRLMEVIADPRSEFEEKLISQEQVKQFIQKHLDKRDMTILILRMEGYKEEEIAGLVNYSTASAVSKRIAKIADEYDDFVSDEYRKLLDKIPDSKKEKDAS